MGLLTAAGSVLGKVWNKVPIPQAAKKYWPFAIDPAMQLYSLSQNYAGRQQAAAQQAAHRPRRAWGQIPGSSSVDNLRGLMPKISGDKNMTSLSVLDKYLEQQRAFTWGAELFCKQAGFDEADTKVMMELLKEAAPRLVNMRLRHSGGPARTAVYGAGGHVPPSTPASPLAVPGGLRDMRVARSFPEQAALDAQLAARARFAGGRPNTNRTPDPRPTLSGDKMPTTGAISADEVAKALNPASTAPLDAIAAAAAAGKAPRRKLRSGGAVWSANRGPTGATPGGAVPAAGAAAEAKPTVTTPGGAVPAADTVPKLREALSRRRRTGKIVPPGRSRRGGGGGETKAPAGAGETGDSGSPDPAATTTAATTAAATTTPPPTADTTAPTAPSGPPPKADRSWLPWAGLLGGGYLAHGYGTEGGTYSIFDPPEVRAQKQKNRNEALGIKSPSATATSGSPAFAGDDVAARNKTMVKTYLKQLALAGPDDPNTVAANFYGGATQPSNRKNFLYYAQKDPAFLEGLRQQFDANEANKILAKLQAPTTGQTGGF